MAFYIVTRHVFAITRHYNMSESIPLTILIELRSDRDPPLTQVDVAKFFGLKVPSGRQIVINWEKGKETPSSKKHRERFIEYLWDNRGLRRDQKKFAEVWQILATAWKWAPLNDADWSRLTVTPRLHTEQPVSEPLPVPTVISTTETANVSIQVRQLLDLDGFIRRREWTEIYTSQLASTGVALITGMAGAGKTTLATYLARQQTANPDQIFWYAFHAGEQPDGAEAMLKRLAGFLAQHGRAQALQTIQTAEQHNRLLPLQTLLDELLSLCEGQHYLICLDDFHHVGGNTRADLVLQRLQTAAANGVLKLILTARQLAQFTQIPTTLALSGLTWTETQKLWQQSNAQPVPASQLEALWQRVDGHPKTLLLVIEWLRHHGDLTQLLARPLDAENLRLYLLDEVNAAFTLEEQQIMKALAILPRAIGSHALLEAMVDQDIYLTLLNLTRRHMLTIVQGESGQEYRQHAILQTFYDNILFWRERLTLHRRAGAYYEAENRELLTAAEHYIKAREQAHAAELIGHDPRDLINRGQARRLLRLIEQLEMTILSPTLQAGVQITRSSAALALGNLEMAERAVHEGWTLLPETPTVAHIRALTNISTLYGQQGDLTQAVLAAQRGIELSQQLRDFSRLPDLLSNLGGCRELGGAWQEAVTFYEQALDAAAQLGSTPHQVAQLKNNLGILLTNQGHYQAAQSELLAAQQLADRLLLKDYQVSILVSLADLYVRWEKAADAKDAIDEAHQVAKEIGADGQLPEIFTCYAQIKLLQGDPQMAYALIQQAIRAEGDNVNQGKAKRVLGQVWLAQGKLDLAQAALEQSLVLVADDVYELARTQTQLGTCLLQRADKAQTFALLKDARHTFVNVGATHDLAIVEKLLAPDNSQQP